MDTPLHDHDRTDTAWCYRTEDPPTRNLFKASIWQGCSNNDTRAIKDEVINYMRAGRTHRKRRPSRLFGTALGMWLMAAAQGQNLTIEMVNARYIEGQDLVVRIKCDLPVSSGFTVQLHATDSSTNGPTDYLLPSGPITFVGTANEEQLVSVPTVDDQIVEPDEEVLTFYMTCSDPYVDATHTTISRIIDNDMAKITIQDAVAYEGDDLVFQAVLDKEVSGGVHVRLMPDVSQLRSNRSRLDELVGVNFNDPRDVVADSVDLFFLGTKNDTLRIRYKVLNDFKANEPAEFIYLKMKQPEGDRARVDVTGRAIGTLLDTSAQKHCPPENFLKNNDEHELLFFGDGALVSTYESEADLAANTGVGIRWTEHFPDNAKQKFGPWYRVDLEGQVNVASTADSLLAQQDSTYATVFNGSAFGSSVLVPKLSGQSADVRLTLYNRQSWGGIVSGLSFRYVGANNYWSRRAALMDSTGVLIGSRALVTQVNMHMFRASIFHEFMNYKERKDFSAQIRASYMVNWIRGDLGLPENAPERTAFIGTQERNHRGWELGLAFRLKNLEADVSYSNLTNRSGLSVSGLSDGRLVTTIRFVGGFKASLD